MPVSIHSAIQPLSGLYSRFGWFSFSPVTSRSHKVSGDSFKANRVWGSLTPWCIQCRSEMVWVNFALQSELVPSAWIVSFLSQLVPVLSGGAWVNMRQFSPFKSPGFSGHRREEYWNQNRKSDSNHEKIPNHGLYIKDYYSIDHLYSKPSICQKTCHVSHLCIYLHWQ